MSAHRNCHLACPRGCGTHSGLSAWFLVGAEAEISALKNPKDACEFLRIAVAYLLLEDGAEQHGDDLRNESRQLFQRGRCF